MMEYISAAVYFLSCAPGIGLLVFAGAVSFGGTFKGTLGLLALLAIFVGSFALIVLGLFMATAIWIVLNEDKKRRPQTFMDLVKVLDIASVFQVLLDRTLSSPKRVSSKRVSSKRVNSQQTTK
jgi:membrane protein DedA with SNARE-associated domain